MYTKHNFASGETLYASQLNEMDEQIGQNAEDISDLDFRVFGGTGIVRPDIVVLNDKLIINDGKAYDSNGWCCTEFVDVSGANGSPITITSTIYGNACTAWYRQNKTLIGYINGKNAAEHGLVADESIQTYTVTLPSDTYYVRVCGYFVGMGDDSLDVSYERSGQKAWDSDLSNKQDELTAGSGITIDGATISANVVGLDNTLTDDTKAAPAGLVGREIEAINDRISSIENGTDEKYSPDIVAVDDTMILSNGSAYAPMSGWESTDFVSISGFIGKVKIHATVYGNASVVWYDANKNRIGYMNGTNSQDFNVTPNENWQTFEIELPNDAKYIRLSGNKSTKQDGEAFSVEYAKASHLCHYDKVLVIGDSISTDAYGNYKKWVTMLMEDGYLPADTVNNSQHATGFVARYDNKPNDFITRIKAVDNPAQYNLVIVFGGINDYIQNKPFGSDTDTDYLTYVKPAVKEFYSYLTTNFINARIAVLTPLAIKESAYPNNHGTVNDYSDYYMSVIRQYRLPVLDLTYTSGLNPNIEAVNVRWMLEPMPDKYPGIHDGVHPTEEYIREFLVPMIRGFLESI